MNVILRETGERPCPICREHGQWFDTGELIALLKLFDLRLERIRKSSLHHARKDGRMSGIIAGFWALLFQD